MDADLLLVGQTESVFTDEGDSECLAVHGLFPTGPVHKLILCLQKSIHTVSLMGLFINLIKITVYDRVQY